MRLDSHVVSGYRVPPNYDSMVAKLLVHQPTRAEALAAMCDLRVSVDVSIEELDE